ncbi:MAG: ATP synthase F1 subunit delta [Spirochaetales bacterium]|jgi:F-type H+-transporting ATPase subunit delta|nr:ATP synthase F1 subunit delta [Spirochaetales bacterium]
MFEAKRWARAFLAACGDQKEDGIAALRVFEGCMERVPIGTGTLAANRLEKMIRASMGASSDRGVEAACRTLTLLVKKGLTKRVSLVLQEAEKIREAENGILNVVVDSAFALDEEFTTSLRGKIKEETAAREVRLNVRLMPRLIGGVRLHIGTECFDASVRGQLHKMAADLRAAGGFAW